MGQNEIEFLASKNLIFRDVKKEDIQEIAITEAKSYPEDEMATLESLTYRQQEANIFFKGVFDQSNGKNIGYICSTACHGDELEHDSMTNHIKDGKTLCIHSVCVHPDYLRQGIATAMLKHYVTLVSENIDLIFLMCKEKLVKFYENCGFKFVRISPVVHGKDQWLEMKMVCH